MVTRLGCVGALLGCCVLQAAASPTSFTVKSVVVGQDGQWHDDPNGRQTPEDCARFRVSKTVALQWFRRSREVTDRAWREELDWTQCSAVGTLVTGDGRQYRWELDQAGRGRVILTPGASVYLSGPELPSAKR